MVTRVGAATGTTTATPPAHAVGDFFVLMAFRDGSLTPPTIPSGEDWMPLGAATAANTCSAVFVAKRCDSASETVGTFANATGITLGVWRPASGKKLAIGGWGPNSGTATSVTYPALPLVAPAVSWVAGMAGHRSVNTTLESAPTGMANVAAGSFADATNEMALHDTNGAAASWPSTGVAVGGTASGWISFVFELREYTDVLTRFMAARDHPTDNALVIGAGHSLMAAAAAVNAGTMTGDAIKFGYLQQVADAFTVCVARSSDASFMGEQNSSSYNSPDLYNTNLALHGWVSSAPGIKGLGWGALTPAAASTLTWDADIAYDRLTVYYPRFTGSPEYAANVDGGASLATLNMNDAVGVFASESFSVSLATHQLRFVAAATGGYISGAIVWNSAVKQVTFLNCSAAGALVSDFLVATTYAPLVSMRAFGSVALTIIHLDANEILNAVAVDTFRFSLAQFVLERLFYGDVSLISSCYMSPTGTGISEATQRTYHDAVAQLATVLGADFIRGTDQIATFAAGNALGYYDPDGVHMPAAGYGVGYKVPLLAKLNATSTQTLTPSLFSNTATFYAPTVTRGAVSLTPGLLSNVNAFHAPVVAPGAVLLTPGLLSNAQTFYGPTVSPGAVGLDPPLVSNASTFPSATVAPGAVQLAPDLLTNGNVFPAAIVAPGQVTLGPGLQVNTSVFHAAVVSQDGGPQALLPDLLVNASVFPAATVAPGAVILAADLFTNANAFHAPTVGPGAVSLGPGLLVNAQVFYPPTVVPPANDNTLLPGLLTNVSVFYAPTVTGGGPRPASRHAGRVVIGARIGRSAARARSASAKG